MPLTITVMTRWFSSGCVTGMHAVTVVCASITPEDRKTMPAAGPLICTDPEEYRCG